MKMAATETGSPRQLGLNLNLSVQPHVTAYHWPQSTVASDISPCRSKVTDDNDDRDDDDDDDNDDDDENDDVEEDDREMDEDLMDCRQDDDCSPEDEEDILEMQVSL